MARFSADEVDNYGGSGGHGFFSLKDDRDTAKVRFMYDGFADVQGDSVHAIEIDGKKRYVNCIRNYKDPVDACPFCAAKMPQYAKLFVPIYDIAEDTVKIWERGKKFFGEMSSLCTHYASSEPLCSHVFEIERIGKKGDQATQYKIYDVDKDNTTLDDLPELPEILGGFVLDKTAEDMEYFLKNGRFADGNSDAPIERRPASNDIPRRRF